MEYVVFPFLAFDKIHAYCLPDLSRHTNRTLERGHVTDVGVKGEAFHEFNTLVAVAKQWMRRKSQSYLGGIFNFRFLLYFLPVIDNSI